MGTARHIPPMGAPCVEFRGSRARAARRRCKSVEGQWREVEASWRRCHYFATAKDRQNDAKRDASVTSDAMGFPSEHHKSPSSAARTTASVRVLTANFRKMRLTCDFTVSGEIARARAMRLLEQPWLIIASTSHSRAVGVAPAWLLGPASWVSHHDGRLPAKDRRSRSFDPDASVTGTKVANFGAGLIDLFLSMEAKLGWSLANLIPGTDACALSSCLGVALLLIRPLR
jgi:hypothetical protein